MKKIKVLFTILLIFMFILILSSCISDTETVEKNTNDKEYSISELIGVYHAERYSNGTTYEYTLVISSDATGKLDEESYTFESKRAGITWEKSYGTGDIALTKKDITLLGYKGYIENGDIILTINDKEIVFEK
ncbi:MAG: hypothetical protein ACI4MI_05410 [Christensenellales bacterium]